MTASTLLATAHAATPVTLMFVALAAAFALALGTWLVSVAKRDVSIVDGVWSLLVLSAALIYAWLMPAAGPVAQAALLLALVWAVRLSAHISWRSRGEPEDHRYQAIRARNQPNFALKSLYLVFALQAALAWLVAFPLMAIVAADQGGLTGVQGWPAIAGAMAGFIVATFGIAYEAIADLQLLRFKRRPESRGRVMNTGLWRFSRHPNYFGEFCVWWGFFIVALSVGGAGAAWSLLSPLLMSVLLMKVSGVTLLEKDIVERRPGYREYVMGTNAFFPGVPRKSGAAVPAPSRP